MFQVRSAVNPGNNNGLLLTLLFIKQSGTIPLVQDHWVSRTRRFHSRPQSILYHHHK
jgi:hypothetical protein